MTLTSGQTLQNRYRIVSMLGQGGMGAVYRAWDTRLNVSVAVKEMIPQPGLNQQTLTQLRQQFQQEAQILARLVHPYLVRVTDFFEEDGNAYLVMDFVEGESLVDLIEREGALPEPQVLEWTYQLLEALGYCHDQGIIHRDIKPQNVIIRSDGRAVLVDFGLVKLWDPNDPHTRTAMRGMGTPEYAPPEQYDTQAGHTDPRSDIYGLGATIYHALTGQAPPTATMRIANPVLFQRPRTLTPHITSTTENAVLRATELALGNRFADTQEMAAALRGKSVPTTTVAVTPGVPERTRVMPGATAVPGVQPIPVAGRRRVPTWVWAVGGVAVVAIIFGAILIGGRGRSSKSADSTATAIAIAALEATDTPSPTLPPSPSPSPSPTPVPTETQTPTSAPTETPTPPRTKPPTSTPRHTPEVTPTETPTGTPTATRTTSTATRTASTPTRTPTPRPTSAPTSGALIDFEQFGTWRRGDQPYGQLTQTREQVKTGSYAAKLSYNFPASGDDYVVFLRTLNLAGRPNTFGAWVYGDGSGHLLTLWVQDAQNQVWSVYLGKVSSAGWKQMVGTLAPNLAWPSGHISGPDNGVIDYPVRFHALVLDRPGGAQNGQIYIDDISAWQGTAPTVAPPAATSPPAVATTAPQPPSGQAGRIFYTIEAGDAYYLGSTDPGWSQGQVLDPIAYNQSTCAGGAKATTLSGQSVNLFYGYRCAVGSPQECPSPDGVYKVVLWEQRGNFSVSMYRVSDNQMLENIYNGSLNRDEPILWAPDSSRFYFTVDHTLHMARPGAAGYQPVISTAYEPYLSPDGSSILYRMPVGTAGAYDVMVANYDGSGQHNATNAPEVYKLCARWGGY
jgi:serine/threonine protein kinase